MCVLIIKPAGAKMPPKATLKQCFTSNPDGCGFAQGEKIVRSLNFETWYDEVSAIAERDKDAIIHFRYATHGSVRVSNCHPFKDSSTGAIFAHNGVLPIKALCDKTDSETYFKTCLVPLISKYGAFSKEVIEFIGETIGCSRFALMQNGEVRKFGVFHEYNGCHYSNLRWMNARTYYSCLCSLYS